MRAFLLHSGEEKLRPLLERLTIPHGTGFSPAEEGGHLLIHWGAYHPDRGGADVLQPVKAVLLAGSRQRAGETLELHGMVSALGEEEDAGRSRSRRGKPNGETPEEEGGWVHDFLVPVFHLEALTLLYRRPGVFYGDRVPAGVRLPEGLPDRGYEEVSLEQPTYYGSKALREAVKALYALGLDYGVVRIGVRTGGTLAVRRVEAVPELTPRLAELFAAAMNKYGTRLEERRGAPRLDVMLGADPEFLLLNDRGKVRFASAFMDKDGPVGCDAIVLPSRRKIYPLAELRPRPSTEVRELIVQLHRTLQLAARRITDEELVWVAGGMPVKGFPLGGHIHFSRVDLESRLLRVLDNYLALPLTLIEDGTTGLRRPQYGFLGDFRRQRHGGFEYRVLPSWMVSPTVAKGVLALAKLSAEHYPQLRQRPLSDLEVAKAYYRGDKARIRPLLPALWRDLERLPGYAALEGYLLPLRRLMVQMRPWNEREDIRSKWKIRPYS
ncbi:putative amidoligase domain-containing protein [Paenibacillus sp. S-38]|uniref:putative amidoligase domain-containing protein n=1 Tax=Paenibacillus sp. S-38 TaxID=3416710 RepID=UPI003CEE2361